MRITAKNTVYGSKKSGQNAWINQMIQIKSRKRENEERRFKYFKRSVFLSSFSFLFESFSFISLVVPLLSNWSVGTSFSKSFQLQFRNWSDSLDEGWEGVDLNSTTDLLIFLQLILKSTFGVSLRIPFLALVTGAFSFLGKRTSLLT